MGLLDVDLHGPSVSQLLGLNGAVPKGGPGGMQPLQAHGVKVMSVGNVNGWLLPWRDLPGADRHDVAAVGGGNV